MEPTIYFFAKTIKLKTGDEVVSWKSTTFMYATPDGEGWKRQIEKELAAKGRPTIPREQMEPSKPPIRKGDSLCISRNADRRQNFLGGSELRCANGGAGAWFDRVALRDQLFVHIPEHADFSNVWIWCDLCANGTEHPAGCALNTQEGDPAKRLGILAKYNLKKTDETEEFWHKVRSERDLKKVNTLVDFLDGESYDYTLNQPRRFVPKRKGKNLNPEMYI